MKKITLTTICILGFILSVSEGSTYFWANLLGLLMFGFSAHQLGLFDNKK